MPWYEHECELCKHEWEDLYGICAEPPEICPKCGERSAKRVISGGQSGACQLTGQELKASLTNAAKTIQKEANKNENLQANLTGEMAYEQQVQRKDANRNAGGTDD